MKKQLIVAAAFALAVGATSQADVVLGTDFTGFTTDTNTMTISDFTWSSDLGEGANATTSLALTGPETTNGFLVVTTGTGGTGPAVGVRDNIRSNSWSTTFTFTPSQSLEIEKFEVSSYSIKWAGGHQTTVKTVTWALDITSAGTDFSGSVTETEPGGDAPQLFSIDTTGTTLAAGTLYTFSLTVSGGAASDNNIALDTLTLKTASSLPPIINEFSLTPTSVFSNETVTLSWDVEDATTLSIDQGIGDVPGMGSTQIVVVADTTYTLTAGNPPHGSTNAMATVTTIKTPPVINSFVANHTTVSAGQTVTLSWGVRGADTLAIDQGVGTVTGMVSTQVVVNADIIYTLTASNSYGDTDETVEILIGNPNLVLNGGFEDPEIAADKYSGAITDWTKAQGYFRLDRFVVSPSTSDGSLLPGTDFDAGVINQATRLGGTAQARATQDLIHNWAADDSFTLSFNASEVWWKAGPSNPNDDLTISIFETEGGALLWETGAIALDDTHLGNVLEAENLDWAANQTFSYDLDTSGFTNGTAGSAITIELKSHGIIWVDNVSLIRGAPAPIVPAEDFVISGPVSSGTEMVLSWTGVEGTTYSVETNSNLIIVSGWKTFLAGLPGDGGTMTVTNTIGPDQTFYRVISE